MKGLLKFITCGSVDDGKSTLIGHILYEAKLIYADQEKALALDSKVGSREGNIDYSLLLDGLMAEREQGITIDVAYRYFTTDNRSFIVADTPGHEEYTRNMAVGASFADLAIILVDAKQGVLVQTRRHARICALMGIKHFVFAVNKMDLIQYDKTRFKEIETQIDELTKELNLANVKIIPVSATEGDNIMKKSPNITWYQGEALLPYLETIDIDEQDGEEGTYMPVQRVCRPNHTFRGFQGQIETGSFSVGDEITTLPSNEKAQIKSLLVGDKEVTSAVAGQPVTIQLNKEVDVSRGCVLKKETNITLSKTITVTLLWMDDSALNKGQDYLVKIGTKQIPCMIQDIHYKIDVNTGKHLSADALQKNEIAVCDIILSEKVAVDAFKKHKVLGELILINRISHMTSACGVVESTKGKQENDFKTTFWYQNLKARGDAFEEYYLNLSADAVVKVKPSNSLYTVGDSVPAEGESYHYPSDFDIIILRDKVVVQVRNQQITAIQQTASYQYEGVPIINGRGYEVTAKNEQEVAQFLEEYDETDSDTLAQFYNKWLKFSTYRSVIFTNNFWKQ